MKDNKISSTGWVLCSAWLDRRPAILLVMMFACQLAFLAMPLHLVAQGPTGSIEGTVTDSSRAALPQASVTLLNNATGTSRTVQTDRAGIYAFPTIPPGTYNVTVTHGGFATVVRSNIVIQVQQAARIDFSLPVGEATQTVNVVADAALLSSEDATIGQVIDNKRIVELPLNGRSYLQLTTLSPGVTNTSSPSSSSSFQGGLRGAVSITINGQRNEYNHFTLDGIENTDPNFNTYIFLPSLDAIQEYKLQTATYPADYGFAISQINVSTLSGSNKFHGSVFDFLRNSWFDAKNYFDNNAPIPSFRRNQFGGTFGGPILKNRLFFMGNYEGLRDSKAQTIVTTVPSAALLSGNFSSDSQPIYDPSTRVTGPGGVITATPFPGNMIPSSRFSPIAVALLQYYSVPNYGTGTVNNHVNNESLTDNNDQSMLRIDYQMNAQLSWFGRWNYDKDAQYVPGNFRNEGGIASTRPDQVLAGATQTFGSNLVNDSRFGWSRFVNNLAGYDAFKNNINGNVLHIPGLNPINSPAFWGVPQIGIGGYSTFGEPTTVYLTHDNIWEGHDTLSWTRGKHLMRFGGVYEPIHYNETGNQFALGHFLTDGSASGNPAVAGSIGDPVADFLLGYVSSSQTGLQPADAGLVGTYYAIFASDTFHMTSHLTVDYGLRYEYLPPLKDVNDASSNLSGLNTTNPTLVRASNQGTNLDPYGGLIIRLTNINLVRDGSLGPGLVNPDKNNFAPRLGVVYSPDDKWVIRAGIGTFYDILDMGNSTYDMARTLAGAIQVPQNPTTLDLTFSNPFAGTSTGSGTTVTIATPTVLTNDVNLRTTYVNQWTLDFQRSLSRDTVVDIGYVGSQGHRLKREAGLNIPQPGPGNSQLARPWQNYGFVQHTVSVADSNYNGLQAKLEKRMSRGVTVLSAYTYSKSIDNTSGIRPGAGDVIFPANPFNIGRGERGLSSFDARHRWVTSALVESPVGKDKHFSAGRYADAILGSWQLGGIFSMQTGGPLTPVDNNDVANIGNGYTDRPNVTGISPKLSHRTPQEFFNTAAFVPNPAYTFGNAGRNSVEGPGLIDLDMSLMKSIPFGDRVASQFRWDLFNVANHPIFGLPNNAINSTAFGTISSTIVDSREMQISLRVVF